ncbi:hypothetical protein AOQ84DRAFT_12759 [Glonium stellatum]|uniref:Uncharacterized protein n=1 Tax=Glonium stellatum TaxID=574774 RepID=A0A8E2JLD8_9PEZI|nr:hypothetical protein AOQ84DRAFT_12759 [Glonium stellatum]
MNTLSTFGVWLKLFYHAKYSPGRRFHLLFILSSAFFAGREELRESFYMFSILFYFVLSVFYRYYLSTRACTHCAVYTTGIWFGLATRFSFCYLRYNQYRKRLNSVFLLQLFLLFFFVMHGEVGYRRTT